MAVTIIICIIVIAFCQCSSHEKKQYYFQKENYINVTGTISSIRYNDDFTALYFEFCELLPALDDTCFKIVGDNLPIVRNNKIDTKLKIGAQIDFITAPKYFGDGYVMPIVAVSINGESLLDFENGYSNLLNWLSN